VSNHSTKLISKIKDLTFSGASGAYWLLNPKKRPRVTWRSGNIWKVYDVKTREIYTVPSKKQTHRGHKQRRQKVFQKYTSNDFVEVEPDDTVLDIGAFIGEFSICAQELGATVYALEPTPLNFSCLSYNTKKIESITPYQTGIWKENTTLTFSIGEDQTESSLFNVDTGKVVEKQDIDVQTVNSFIKEHSIDSVDFLKVEAEGAEPEVLQGSVSTDIKKVAVDAGAERYGKETADTVEEILNENGYETTRSHSIVFGRK
jgi:FkbM family methyltransferase